MLSFLLAWARDALEVDAICSGGVGGEEKTGQEARDIEDGTRAGAKGR